MKEIIEQTISSGLIYLNSSAEDFKNPQPRPLLDKYLRGSDGAPLDRSTLQVWTAG
ncbi:MAG: 4-hydroxyphenylacetate 3-hydroxylase C-terminal domain-containing protein [Candidatus Binataceae bacterium]